MKLHLEINNQTKDSLDEKIFQKIVQALLEEKNFSFLHSKEVFISLAIVSPWEIKKWNKLYRQKDKATDVLSFPEYDSLLALRKTREKKIFLGEIVLCYNDIKVYAQENKINLLEELTRVTAHGILHLLGLEHGKEMFRKQELITRRLVIKQ